MKRSLARSCGGLDRRIDEGLTSNWEGGSEKIDIRHFGQPSHNESHKMNSSIVPRL